VKFFEDHFGLNRGAGMRRREQPALLGTFGLPHRFV
jgi:hypothetical protein